jgi:hypothetical protein
MSVLLEYLTNSPKREPAPEAVIRTLKGELFIVIYQTILADCKYLDN